MVVESTNKSGYQLVREVVRRRIAEGEWGVGCKLPSDRDFEKELGLSRPTISKGLSSLTSEGLLRRRQGQGTFVAERVEGAAESGNLIKYISPVNEQIAEPVRHGVLAGIHGELIARGHAAGVDFYKNSAEQVDCLRRNSGEPHGGFVIWPAPDEALMSELERLSGEGYPFVLADDYLSEIDCDSVATNNVEGGRIMAEHLIGLGHRRIAYVTRPLDRSSLRDRQAGFLQGVIGRGLPVWNCGIVQLKNAGGSAVKEVKTCVDELLALPELPTAIFFCNDDLALAACEYLSALGRRVPNDISVVGYDDIDRSAFSLVPLTTIKQDFCRLGCVAAQILFERMEHGRAEPFRNIFIKPELVIRESSAGIRVPE